MAKVVKLVLLMLVFVAPSNVYSENKPPIPIESDGDDKNNKNQRTLEFPVSFCLENNFLNVEMYSPIISEILISNSENTVVFDQAYPASSSVQVDLSSLPSGNYYLYIYAYDTWWTGEFEL